jgi:intein/homing endonuclease
LAKFGSYEWEIPLDKLNKETALEWLSAFIDCEGHIENDSIQRHKRIIITSVNLKGLKQIQKLLYDFFNVSSKIYGPYDGIYRITISGVCNLSKLKNMKLNHPMKMKAFSVILNN